MGGDISKMSTVSNIMNIYISRIKDNIINSNSQNVSKLFDELENEIKKIEHCEYEIVQYFEEGLVSGNWEDEWYWTSVVIAKPSSVYLDIFFKIIETNNKSYPHWRILDVLAFMPEDLNLIITKGIEKAIQLNNPAWGEDELKKAFEVLIWIGEDEAIEFIEQQCKSKEIRIAKMAEYWIDWLNDEYD